MSTTYKNGGAYPGHARPVRFDTKIAVLLRDDLEMWQRLNVTAFLASGIAADPGLLGEPYADADADGTPYLPMFRQPVLVLAGDAEVLAAAHERAVRRGMPAAVFTEELFSTGHDEANRAAVRAVARDDLKLVGLAVHGPRNAVDKVLRGAVMHP
jgi:hypothetical protein